MGTPYDDEPISALPRQVFIGQSGTITPWMHFASIALEQLMIRHDISNYQKYYIDRAAKLADLMMDEIKKRSNRLPGSIP